MSYLKITPSPDPHFDSFYYRIDGDKTWATALDHIESALDAQYVENDDLLWGIKLEIEIVKYLPEDCEEQEAKHNRMVSTEG